MLARCQRATHWIGARRRTLTFVSARYLTVAHRPSKAVSRLVGQRDRYRQAQVHGRSEIRTHESLSAPHAFQACALNHSATRPSSTQKRGEPGSRCRCPVPPLSLLLSSSGRGEIRTHDTGFTGMPVFETGAFNHSATRPGSHMAPANGRHSTQRPRRNVNRPHPAYQRTSRTTTIRCASSPRELAARASRTS
jgi:hypothetical protein